MKQIKQNMFLATVLAFALTSSGCAALGGLLGGGGGGDLLGGLIPGLTLTDSEKDGLHLTSPQAQVKNGYRIIGGSVPEPSRQEASLYSSF